MAGRADILAGLAAVELIIKDAKFNAGLKNAQAKLRSFGKAVAITGGFIAAAGAAIAAPFTVAIHQFTEYGDVLDKMSKRTGVGADKIAELAYAAEQGGASLEALEKGLKHMATEGIPITRFDEIAAKIDAIADPSKKLQEAKATWGKAGAALIPMLHNLKAVRAEARALGIVFTPEQVRMADELKSAITRIKTAVFATTFQVGAALAPALIYLADGVKYVVVAFGAFVRNNPTLVRGFAMLGAVLLSAGTALVVIGGGFAALSVAIGGIVSAVSAAFVIGDVIMTFVAATGGLILLVPVAIAGIAAIAAAFVAAGAAVVAFLRYTKTGQAITRWFIELGKVVAGFAIVAGVVLYKSLQLTWGVLKMIGRVVNFLLTPLYELGKLFLKLGNWIVQAMLLPINRLIRAFSEMGKTVGLTFKMVMSAVKVGDFEAAWKIAIAGMEATWHSFAATVLEGLAKIAEAMIGLNLITGGVGPDWLNAAAKGERLDATRKMMEAARLSKASQLKAGGGSITNGPPVMKAVTIGYNARSAMMGRQILGAGRNPILDAIKAGVKLTAKTNMLLDTIEKKLPTKVR